MLLFIAFILLAVEGTTATAAPARGESHNLAWSAGGLLEAAGGDLAPELVEEAIRRRLAESGFERVAVVFEGGELIVTYENRLYAYEVRALKEVLTLLQPFLDTQTEIILIPQHSGISLLAVTISSGSYLDFVRGRVSKAAFASTIAVSTDPAPYVDRLEAEPMENRTAGKLDLVLHPQITAQLGSFSDPVRSQVNIAPEVTTTLWKGMTLSAQAVLPLQSDFGEDDGLRPGAISIRQRVRLPHTTTLTAAAGLFTLDRYGVDLTATKHFANGRWHVGANVGYTGFATFEDDEWFYDHLERWTPSASIGFRVPRYNLTIDATAGRFTLADEGFRVDIGRRFGPISIGFFGQVADGDKNAGFALRLPLLPAWHMAPGPVRIRVANSADWQYEYRGVDASVRNYRTSGSPQDFWKGLEPAFLRNLITRLKDWS